MKHKQHKDLLGWGVTSSQGFEVWDSSPVFMGDTVTLKDRLKLLFYPKKFFLYSFIARAKKQAAKTRNLRTEPFRILDVGCGTGASLIDLKKLFGKDVDVVGIDVVQMQLDIAKRKLKSHGIWPHVKWYDGVHIPFGNMRFDAVYTSDVLGHVADVPAWLGELSSVLKPGGVLAMFSESLLGKHAYIRKYLFERGVNTDPHKQYHISLYSKAELKSLLETHGFFIHTMRSSFWATFFVHPDELYEALQAQSQFVFLKTLNAMLYRLKQKTHPYSMALAELYGLVEMMTLGRWVESQGYVILAKKKE